MMNVRIEFFLKLATFLTEVVDADYYPSQMVGNVLGLPPGEGILHGFHFLQGGEG